MDDAKIDWNLAHVDTLVGGMTRKKSVLVERREERAGFHLNHGEVLAVVEVEVAAVLQVGAAHGQCALVVERRAEDEEWSEVGAGEAVGEPVGVAGVLVVDDI